MNYLISVGIATRNRQYYAEKVIRKTSELDESIEICVSDNSTENTLENDLADLISSGQVKYRYIREKISVVENYNNTAAMANGEYYICIGDDDLILPTIFDVVRWMKENKIDAVRSSRQLNYKWPVPGNCDGTLSVGYFTTDCHTFNAFESVVQLLKNGCQGYLYSDLAGSYHALVRMEKMQDVREISGFYFSGFSPDIYSAVCLSLLENLRCAYFDFPVSVPGWCIHSATYRGRHRIAVSTVDEAIKNYSKEGYLWEKLIPRYYTPETTWAETVLKALKKMGRQDLVDRYFNRELLVNLVYNRWSEYRDIISENLTKEELGLLHEDKSYLNPNQLELGRTFFDKVYSRITGDVRVYCNVKDNYEAEKCFMKYIHLRRQKRKWEKLLQTDIP